MAEGSGAPATGGAGGAQGCFAAGWRAVANKPTPSTEIALTSVAYYEGPVLLTSWPALIPLAMAVMLLLVFLLW